MLKDVEFKEDKQYKEKSHYRFTVMLELGGLALESTGWRWWPTSDAVKPPQTQYKGKFINTFRGVTAEVQEKVRRKLKKVLEIQEDESQVDNEPVKEPDDRPRKISDEKLREMLPGLLREWGEHFMRQLGIELKAERITQADYEKIVEMTKELTGE